MSAADQLAALGVPDVQGGLDDRGVYIDQVGIDQLSYPIEVGGRDGSPQRTVAEVGMTVDLAHDARGVHMSRFVEILDARAGAIGTFSVIEMAEEMRARLDSDSARVEFQFPWFLRREAPASGISSMNRYEARLLAEVAPGVRSLEVGVRVPVTSLCPCSKEISDYGAHNQRGYVDISVQSSTDGRVIWFEDLVEIAEQAGSAPIYPLLKRSDERLVTMQAYDEPAFVEDIIRDVLLALRADARVQRARVRVSNQESIHAHNAVAQLQWEREGV